MLISHPHAEVTLYMDTAEKGGKRTSLMSHFFSGVKFECRRKALRFL
jgi:hypothetical protein